MEAYYVISLLLLALVLFSIESFSVDLVTLGLLVALVLPGIITPEQAFAGFSDTIIIMLGSIFVIGTALRDTGVLDMLGGLMVRVLGTRPTLLTSVMMTGVSAVSAFMNNTTVTAMFLGPIMGVARQARIPPSRVLMPLAFASILGGTCTLIGTSTNVAVSGYMRKTGYGEMGMFELTPIGLVLVVVGMLYMLLIGIKLLPDRGAGETSTVSRREYLAEVIVLPTSPLIGQELYSSDFSVLGFRVLRILRKGQEVEATQHERFAEGDVALIAGKVQDLIRIKKIEGIDILEDANQRASSVDMGEAQIAEVILTAKSTLVGRTLRGTKFRERSGLSVIAIHRGDKSLLKQIGEMTLQAGDVLLVQGPMERFHPFEESGEMVLLTRHYYTEDARRRGLILLVVFACAVALSTTGLLNVAIAMLIVAMFAVLTRCISLETAYENIDWRLLILIGGMTAFGQATSQSGAANLLANGITNLLSSFGPTGVLAGFCVLTIALTQPMSNAAAALVVLPIALSSAEQLHVNPKTFGVAVMLSASVSLITPFEPSCILVFGPGRYRFFDFLKVGGGLSLVLLLFILWLVPHWWPL